MKKELELGEGKLGLITLWNGQLVLAELTSGHATKKEVMHALTEAGITYGLIEENLDTLVDDFAGQIPVAIARVTNEVSALWFHFEKSFTSQTFLEWLRNGQPEEFDLSYPVNREDRLVTLSTPPKEVLKYPNGRKTVQRQLDVDSIHFYAGEHVVQGIHKRSLVAEIDGFAHRNLFGLVSVYPMQSIKRIGKMHGPMSFDKALTVEEDVQKDSEVDVTSHLIIRGMVRASILKAGGNIHCALGLEGDGDYKKSNISAGQTLYSSSIRKYKVWSGIYLIVKSLIEDSEVECMNTIYAGMIRNSDIRVGNKLYVHGNVSNAKIRLGYPFVTDPDLKQRKVIFNQKRKRLEDLINDLASQRSNLEARRKNTIAHINKLKKMNVDAFSADGLLNMQYRTLKTGSQQLNKKIREVKEELDAFRKLDMAMSVDETDPYERYEPEIIVKGKIDVDVDIIGTGGELKEKHHLQNVSIRLDAATGRFDITPLKLPGKK